jgi:hypothetical protein
MATMTIRLDRNPKTGKQTVVVKLDSEPDALPIEHETLHKQLIEKLVGKGLKLEDLGEIVIERDAEAPQSKEKTETKEIPPTRQQQKSKG